MTPVNGIVEPIDIAIQKYEKHPSILAIKKKIPTHLQIFSFAEADVTDIEAVIISLNVNKATTFNSIPARNLKQTSDICTLNKIWCAYVSKCTFPAELKLADITATYKGDDATIVKN